MGCTQPRTDMPAMPAAGMQRLEPVAPGSWVLRAWHEAGTGSPSSTVASVTGIDMGAVIQRGRPPDPPPTRDRMSAALSDRYRTFASRMLTMGQVALLPRDDDWPPHQ